METKKTAKADLEKGKPFSFLMGIVVGLAVLFVGFEWGDQELKIATGRGIIEPFVGVEVPDITTQVEVPLPPPPPPPQQQEVQAEVLTIVEDNVDVGNETLASSEANELTKIFTEYISATFTAPIAVEEDEEELKIFEIVEDKPEFPGGMTALNKFLSDNIKYPVVAQENAIYGRVTCQFVVNQDGSIVDIVVTKGVDPSLDKEAIRVIAAMPKWKPGMQRNKPVRVRFFLPITFKLNN